MPQKRPRSRLTVDYNVDERLQIGFEDNFLVQEIGFRGTYILATESATRPMIHLGTSSDRIGTPEGYQQVSLTFAKTVPGTSLAPYLSVTYSAFERGLVFPFGVNVQLDRGWSVLVMNDGRKSHVLLNYMARDFYVQGGLIWMKHPAVTIGWGF